MNGFRGVLVATSVAFAAFSHLALAVLLCGFGARAAGAESPVRVYVFAHQGERLSEPARKERLKETEAEHLSGSPQIQDVTVEEIDRSDNSTLRRLAYHGAFISRYIFPIPDEQNAAKETLFIRAQRLDVEDP